MDCGTTAHTKARKSVHSLGPGPRMVSLKLDFSLSGRLCLAWDYKQDPTMHCLLWRAWERHCELQSDPRPHQLLHRGLPPLPESVSLPLRMETPVHIFIEIWACPDIKILHFWQQCLQQRRKDQDYNHVETTQLWHFKLCSERTRVTARHGAEDMG